MDLFDLVASLLLNDRDYLTALRAAEQKGREFDGDVEGTISADNQYSYELNIAEHDADGFDASALGSIGTSEDTYTEDMTNAEVTAAEFNPDATGDITTGTNSYDADMASASADAINFSADAQGDISTGTNTYETDLSSAVTSAGNADLDVDGDITNGEDSYTPALEAAETSASSADLDADGELALDSEQFNTDLSTAQTNVTSFDSVLDGLTGKLQRILTTASIVGTVKAIGQAFADAVNEAAEYADTIDKASQTLGMSTGTYQEWQYALKQSGTDMSAVRRGWLQISDAIVTSKTDLDTWLNDTSDLKKALDTLEIDPRNFASAEDMFDKILHELASMPQTDERNNLVTAIFGRGGGQLNALLNSGADGIDQLISRAHELGLVMSDEDITNGVAFGDAMADMNAAVDALKQNIVSGLFPILTETALSIAELVSFFNGRTHLRAFDEVNGIWEDMNLELDEVDSKQHVANDLLEKMAELERSSGGIQGNFELWKGYAERLKQLFPESGNFIDIQNGALLTSTEALKENIEQWAAYEKQQIILNATEKQRQKVSEALSKATEAKVDEQVLQSRLEIEKQKAYDNLLEQRKKLEAQGYDFSGVNFDIDPQDINALSSLEAEMKQVLYPSKNYTAMQELTDVTKGMWETKSQLEETSSKVETLTADYEKSKKAAEEYAQAAQELASALNQIPNGLGGGEGSNPGDSQTDGSLARGLDYVPYNGYTAELHKGESVLTAPEANVWRNGGNGGNIDTAGLAAAVRAAIKEGMAGVGFYFDSEQVAAAVAEPISQKIASGVNAWGG